MSFQEGYTNVSPVEQSIAFWTHTIDVYYDLFWFQGTTMGGRCAQVSELTTELTGGLRSEHAYMGAIRAGFGHAIASLPDGVRLPVQRYLEDKLASMRLILKKGLIDCDVLFGNKDPTNFYYSGIRLQENVPLTFEEAACL